jgi:hypothetical protein
VTTELKLRFLAASTSQADLTEYLLMICETSAGMKDHLTRRWFEM